MVRTYPIRLKESRADLTPFTFWFGRLLGGSDSVINPLFFALIVIPFDFLLVYPGTETLGLHSDSDAYGLMFAIEAIHGLGFYMIQRGIEQFIRSRQ